MPLASIAATHQLSNSALPAQPSAAEASDGDFDSVLASYAPVNSAMQAASAHVKPAPAPSRSEARKPVAGVIKPVKAARAVPRATAVSKGVAKPAAVQKDSAAHASVKPADTGSKEAKQDSPNTPEVPEPVAVQNSPAPIVIGATAQPAVMQAAEESDGNEANKILVPSLKMDSGAAEKSGADTKVDPRTVREQDVPQDTQPKSPAAQPSDAPQAKTVNQLSNQAMDAIAAAAKGQKPEAVASNPIPQAGAGSISALLNAVRGTITAIANPKQAAARADLKPDPKNVVASGARPVPPPSADDHKASTAPVAQHDDTDRGLQSGRPTADDTTRTSSTPEKAATPETAIPTRLAPTATQAVPDGDVLAPFAGPTVSSAASTAPANASDKSASGGNQLAVPSNISALASAIAAKSAAGTKTFDIRMDPPELGRVDVHLSVDSDGKVQASLHAEHPQTLALLQRDSQNLERALKDAGLNLSHNSLNFSLKGEQRQGDGGGASMARSRSLSDAVVARAEAANASEINLSSLRGNGRLDIRV